MCGYDDVMLKVDGTDGIFLYSLLSFLRSRIVEFQRYGNSGHNIFVLRNSEYLKVLGFFPLFIQSVIQDAS